MDDATKEKYRQRFVLFYNKYTPGDETKLQGGTCSNALQALDKLGVERTWASLKKKYGAEHDAEFANDGFPAGKNPSNWDGDSQQQQQQQQVPGGSSYAARATRIYLKYEPEKVSKVSTQLDIYKGREEQFLQQLVMKYGPEPADPSAAASVSPPPALPIPLPTTTASPAAAAGGGASPPLPIPVPAPSPAAAGTDRTTVTNTGFGATTGRPLSAPPPTAAAPAPTPAPAPAAPVAGPCTKCADLERQLADTKRSCDALAQENLDLVAQLQQVTAVVSVFAKKSGVQIPAKFLPLLGSANAGGFDTSPSPIRGGDGFSL